MMVPDEAPPRRRVFLANRYPLFLVGLRTTLDSSDDFEVCGEASSVGQAQARAAKLRPDLAVIATRISDFSDGIELIDHLSQAQPDLAILATATRDDPTYAARALRAGARGFLPATSHPGAFLEALGALADGRQACSTDVAKILSGARGETHDNLTGKLSQRELEVFELISQGYSTRRIAESLSLSVKTIETYKAHIKRKLALEDAAELMRCAFEWRSLNGA